jgi:uncharacterized protein YbbC (DUF1343 family)
VQIHIIDRNKMNMTQVQISILDALLRLFPDYNIFDRARPDRINAFDKAVGNDELRQQLISRLPIEDILRQIDQQRSLYMIKREKYLLYE